MDLPLPVEESSAFSSYYAEMKSKVFGRTDWGALKTAARGSPQVRFIIDKNFDFKAPYAAYDLLVDLSQQFGTVIQPVKLERACISLTVGFADTRDYLDRDFRYLMLADQSYYRLFRTHAVSMLYIDNFPEVFTAVGQPRMPNINVHRFRVDKDGRPLPY